MDQEIASFVLSAAKPEILKKPSFISEGRAWSDVLEFSTQLHCALPVLLNIDRSEWNSELSESIRLQFDERLQRERLTLAAFESEVDSALFLIIGAKISVMAMGEMSYGKRYYTEKVYRPIQNVDLMVPGELHADALRALGKGGYRVQGESSNRFSKVELARKIGGPIVSIHRRPLPEDNEQVAEEIWSRSKEGLIPGIPRYVRCFSVDDDLVYLIRYATAHRLFDSPVLLNDMHFLIESEEFKRNGNWERIVWALSRVRANAGAWFALSLLRSAWGTEIPTVVLDEFAQRTGILRRRVLSRLSSVSALFPFQGRTLPWYVRYRLMLRDSSLDAIRSRKSPRQPGPPSPELG